MNKKKCIFLKIFFTSALYWNIIVYNVIFGNFAPFRQFYTFKRCETLMFHDFTTQFALYFNVLFAFIFASRCYLECYVFYCFGCRILFFFLELRRKEWAVFAKLFPILPLLCLLSLVVFLLFPGLWSGCNALAVELSQLAKRLHFKLLCFSLQTSVYYTNVWLFWPVKMTHPPP